ncbi:hypothetical protein ACW73L_03270 [Methylolobus aquaticus]
MSAHADSEVLFIEQLAIWLFSVFRTRQPAMPVLIESVTAIVFNLLFETNFLI